MSNSKLIRMNLASSEMKGLVCSTNSRPGLTESNAEPLECDSKVRGNEKF
jgi:hypothetical protein